MPSTRSSTKQVKLDEFTDEKKDIKPSNKIASKVKKATPSNTSKAESTDKKIIPQKRENPSTTDGDTKTSSKGSQSEKRKKTADQHAEQQTLSTENINEFEQLIIINRSPVLQLWGAMVAQFLHSDLSWEACLSIGNAISALCAVTKGRAIGVIADNDEDSDAQREKEEKKEKAKEGKRELSVMGFPMSLKNSTAIVGGKSKGLNESTLKGKFGDEGYEQVREAMATGLESWKGDKDELEGKAFHMYEKFRPNVQQGQQGWGRKGELNPHEITNIIKR